MGGGPSRRRGGGGMHSGGMYAEELSPEDIFNMFFGMPPARGHHHARHHHGHYGRQRQGAEVNMNLLQLAPFLLLMGLSVLSSLPFGGESTPYSLRPADTYTLERSTEALGVRYFVAPEFELRHSAPEALRQVEERIEADNLQRVRRSCQAERASKQRMVEAANSNSAAERARMLEAVDAVEMRWCEERDRLEAGRSG